MHERPPRQPKAPKENNEIQGIAGSTRLEAKRQRRRDGRDAGRRRPPILSEAEFLARREAVVRTMIVHDKVRTETPHEGARYTQIAVLEDGVVVEHFVTSASSASLVGNVYLGIVQNVLPSMEAAFVDIGRGRNGVLYAGEVNWEAAGLGGASRKIEQALKPGDYVVVQVSKDPVGHKGARLTTQVSLAGRYLVYVPGASSTGISRKLPDTERQRLKEILREVVPADAGVIIRTASEGVKEDDIRTDVDRLQERWAEIEAKGAEIKAKAAGAAMALYEEPDVLVKVIRDLFNEDFNGLVVSGDDAWTTINEYVESVAPELLPRMTKYEPANVSGAGTAPDVFAVHRIDEQLTKAMDRKVWLPSGGTLVIDRTEAMTVVDVNTGKFTGSGGNLEQTVTRNNLESRRGDRPPTAAAGHRRHHRHRLHRHGAGVQSRSGTASPDRGLGARPDPAPGVRGDVARSGAADPQEAGHRAHRGILDDVFALRRPRDHAAQRPRRLVVEHGPQERARHRTPQQARQEGRPHRRRRGAGCQGAGARRG